jgi:hypothetical protein
MFDVRGFEDAGDAAKVGIEEEWNAFAEFDLMMRKAREREHNKKDEQVGDQQANAAGDEGDEDDEDDENNDEELYRNELPVTALLLL